jgi:hypothetical protein
VEKYVKKMRDKNADDVPGDVLKLLGEDGLTLMIQQVNNIYKTGGFCKDFIKLQ